MKEQVLAFIARAAVEPEWALANRQALGLRLHAWQRAHIPHLDRFCGDSSPETLEQVPAVPVGLFKDGLHFCAGPAGATFRTSGTTQGRRGEHRMPDTQVYELAARLWWQSQVPGCPTRTISLVTNPSQAPDSSLGHMVHDFATEIQSFFDLEGGVDRAGAWAALAAVESAAVELSEGELAEGKSAEVEQPVFVAATAFAMAALMEHPGQVSLPAGSVSMITGGFKGRHVQLSSEQLRDEVQRRLGTPVVEEYGMSELSSQLWGAKGEFTAPPWMLVYTVDPLSGAPTASSGLLRFVDLANWGSCMAIETEDMGSVRGQQVTLLGRLESAPHRGCSLSVEEAGQWRV